MLSFKEFNSTLIARKLVVCKNSFNMKKNIEKRRRKNNYEQAGDTSLFPGECQCDLESFLITSFAISCEHVSPGDSIPIRFTNPDKP
jgi:hypothetical protein